MMKGKVRLDHSQQEGRLSEHMGDCQREIDVARGAIVSRETKPKNDHEK